ncbi:hypothetical protein [Chryseobacterium hagamense]|uniref:C1q domain-containing protein n=1 Tax=Chryseobacterium hagamense TaxID=395935 RepID=A0A511YSC8_9FLAO|nr:hypothetical protein [Chryseobacterium hagamense]GEN78098.1 hypothetical protein CHA01nite_38380 [Chryseobacterium hagamense]
MRKNIFSLAAILAIGTFSAQVRTVNSATNVSVTNSPAFIDASSNTTVNGSSNVGKGLIFPRVDLSAMTAFPGVTAGIPNSFPTRFDGMIVYNTASSGTAGVGSTQGTLTPGYWYYENKTSSNTGGTWKPMSPATSAVANTASNGLTLSGNDVKLGGTLSQPTTINTSVSNPLNFTGTGAGPAVNIKASDYWISSAFSSSATNAGNGTNPDKVIIGTYSGTGTIGAHNNALSAWSDLAINPAGGNVGIGTTTPGAKLDVNGSIKISGGNPGMGKVLASSDANGLANWISIPSSWFAILKGGYLPKLTTGGTERIIDFNTGIISNAALGNYNTSNETITVPYTGNYRITISGWWGFPITPGGFLAIVHLKVNNVALWRPHALGNNGTPFNTSTGICVSFTTVVQLNAGDVLSVYNQENTGYFATQVGVAPSAASSTDTYYPAQLVTEFMGS